MAFRFTEVSGTGITDVSSAHHGLLCPDNLLVAPYLSVAKDGPNSNMPKGIGSRLLIGIPNRINLTSLRWMQMQSREGEWLGAFAFHFLNDESALVETKIDVCLEQMIQRWSEAPVLRDEIVEVPRNAALGFASSRWLFLALSSYLYGLGCQWLVIHTDKQMRDVCQKLGVEWRLLAQRDTQLLESKKYSGSVVYANNEVLLMDLEQAFDVAFKYAAESELPGLFWLCVGAFELGQQERYEICFRP